MSKDNILETKKQLYEELIRQRRDMIMDPYGLTRIVQGSEVNSTTPYDSFILEDALRILTAGNNLAKIRERMRSRIDPATKLYIVTVGDSHTEYYYYATMFNRMKDPTYAAKVNRSIAMMRGLINGMKTYTDNSVSLVASTQLFNIEDDRVNHI